MSHATYQVPPWQGVPHVSCNLPGTALAGGASCLVQPTRYRLGRGLPNVASRGTTLAGAWHIGVRVRGTLCCAASQIANVEVKITFAHHFGRRYNLLAVALNQSALEWDDRRSSDSRLPPPVLANSVPAEITSQQATDPSWRPPDVGNTQKERVESEFVDLLRSHRTHSQEAGSVGQRVALAFVVACANEHFTLEAHLHRLHGVIFDASPSADEIIQALGCTSRQKAVQRHFPQQMLLPQVAFQMKLEAYVADGHDAQHKGGYFEALAGGDWLSILGWRAAMMRQPARARGVSWSTQS